MLIDEAGLKQKFDQILKEFSDYTKTLRTGRPNIDSINSIMVEYYGAPMQLNYIAQISIEGTTATVKLNDKGATEVVRKALTQANLGNVVESEQGVFKINFPPLTEEIRIATVKEMNKTLEERYRAHARRIRQDARDDLKKLEKVPEDDLKRAEERIQKLLDECIEKLDAAGSAKEAEIMTV